MALVERALGTGPPGPYALQAAIAAVHAEAANAAATDWAQIVGLYDVLLRADASPVVALNRAAAVAMRDGPAAGLALIDAILARGRARRTTSSPTRPAPTAAAGSAAWTRPARRTRGRWRWRARNPSAGSSSAACASSRRGRLQPRDLSGAASAGRRPYNTAFSFASSSLPLHRAIASAATPLPIVLVTAMPSPMKRWMPSTMATPATGI